MADVAATIKEVSKQLNRIFRHLLPGVAILAMARGAHPDWFVGRLNLANGWDVVILSALAVGVGNIWYILHRYTLHQLLDYLCYCIRERRLKGYHKWLVEHIMNSQTLKSEAKCLKLRVEFRSAQVILMFLVSETLFLFLWIISLNPYSLVAQNSSFLWLLFGFVLAIALWQYWISNSLDVEAVKKFKSNA